MDHPVQRTRVTFGIEGPLMYASVLDLGRLWERLLRRAGVPLAYTQGYSPHPRLQFASPLPVGYSSECEVMDVWLDRCVDLMGLARGMRGQSPAGLTVREVAEVPLSAPYPQSTLRAAEYRVHVESSMAAPEIGAAIERLLARTSIERRRVRKKGQLQSYDLRPLIRDVRYEGVEADTHRLWMDVQCGPKGSGRPEEIVGAMEVDASDVTIHRIRLVWGEQEEIRA
jgi:radical SAM-linked protein